MKIVDIIKKDFTDLKDDLEALLSFEVSSWGYSLRLLIFILLLGASIFAFCDFPITMSIVWLFYPILLLIIKGFKLRFKKRFKRISISLIVMLSLGIYFSHDIIMDSIGYNFIDGYYSYYEKRNVVVNVGTEVQDTEEREVFIYECDNWTGQVVLRLLDILLLPLAFLSPYFTWKIIKTNSRKT